MLLSLQEEDVRGVEERVGGRQEDVRRVQERVRGRQEEGRGEEDRGRRREKVIRPQDEDEVRVTLQCEHEEERSSKQLHLLLCPSLPYCLLVLLVPLASSASSPLLSLSSILIASLVSWLSGWVIIDIARMTSSSSSSSSSSPLLLWLSLLHHSCLLASAGRTLSHMVDLVIGEGV